MDEKQESRARWMLRQRSFWVAIALWAAISVAAVVLCRGAMPLRFAQAAKMNPAAMVISSSVNLAVMLVLIGLMAGLARRRVWPDLAARAPNWERAMREMVALWIYAAVVMVAGRVIGLHFFGEGIGMHLNGSLFGATRVQSPAEVWTWAIYNFVLLALVPYVVFRARGYSREALNLKSGNLKNDTLMIVVLLAIMCTLDLTLGGEFLRISHRQQLLGGALSFVVHMLGTDLPVMIFIYAVLVPRYFRLMSPMAAYLVGAASYPVMHLFEFWTRYDSPAHGAVSVIFVFLTFFPPGLMKSFLTARTGNAWVHLWAFHAISPHVTVDTRLIVNDFKIAP